MGGVVKSMRWAQIAATPLLSAILACSSGEDGGEGALAIPDGPLSGTVDSEPWEAAAADVRPAPDRTDVVIATFSTNAGDACTLAWPPYAAVYVPVVPGDYSLSPDMIGTFATEEPTGALLVTVTFTGRVVVETVDDATISGRLMMRSDDKPGFEIGGHFSATRCSN